VDDELPLHGGIEMNNKQSPDTTNRRLEASLRYDNVWQKGHSIGLSFQNSPLDTDQVEVYTGTYSLPLGSGTLAGYLVRSNSAVPTLGLTSLGEGTTYGLRYIYPLPGRGSYFHSLTAGFDVKDFNDVQESGNDSSKKPIRYMPFGVQYTGGLVGETGQWLFNLGVNWSLRGFADREYLCPDDNAVKDQFACKRAGAQANFAVLRGDLQRTQVLGGGWDLTARVDFQAASQPLVPSEMFSAGGVDSVRGYLDAERTGDNGWRTRFEMRTPGLWPESGIETRAIGFLDWASLRRQQPLPSEESRYSIGSWGLGLRLRDTSGLHLALDWARALRDGEDTRTEKNSSRLHVRLGYTF
jgi:hemolysin activation/secretion protein